jgi:N6-adenosine-specific RNA methylase IME4
VSKLSLGVEKMALTKSSRPEDIVQLQLEIVIPESIEDVTLSLDTLGRGINAGGWATAACVYAWTYDTGGGRPSKTDEKSPLLNISEFAARSIRGLSSRDAVRAYRDAWTFAIERGWAEPVAPGQHVGLPEQIFTFIRPVKPPAVTPELPAGVYRTIVADPPWDIKTGPEWGSGGAARPLLYPSMDTDAIAALGVKALAAEDAHLYLWTINAYLAETYAIAEAWGFTPSTLLTWCKARHGIGLGGTYVLTTEHILFARRGALAASERVDTSWFEWPRREHSVKPDEFFSMVERVSPGPHLEMFARAARPGWTVWGNEAPDEDPA